MADAEDTQEPDREPPATRTPGSASRDARAGGGGTGSGARAIRAHAAREAGVAYSVAARQLAGVGPGRGESLASLGRTVYPVGVPGRWTIRDRERRPAHVKLGDTRRAARLAGGRAAHLVERFPAGEGHAGPCYAGDGLEDLLAMLYLVVVREAPGLVPAGLDLAWTAELGEETAVDMECADLDRAARLVLAGGVAGLWGRVEDALRGGQDDGSPAVRHDADRLTLVCRRFTMPVEGADGESVCAARPLGRRGSDPGRAAGRRRRRARAGHAGPAAGSLAQGTIIGAHWGPSGPPVRYDVRDDVTRPDAGDAPRGARGAAGAGVRRRHTAGLSAQALW